MNVPAASPAWQNAAQWRSVEFASDLHLCEEAPLTTLAFGHWLRHTRVDALFILGDLFEVWIGDDTRERPFLAACLAELRAASEQRPVFFIAGNRDFLIGTDALAAAGMQALPDPFPITLLGQRLLLSHGDALCLADTEYQSFRQMVRAQAWQQAFLAKPLAEREAIARAIRSDSQGRKQARPDLSDWADADNAESRRWLQTQGASTLVHGHTHRPAVHDLGDGLTRRVLPDWDLDATPARGHVTRLDSQGWHEVPATARP
ncbi:MAG: UDP-2,3-diacylglucosamine diphosphatase [Rubrivivax sp.]